MDLSFMGINFSNSFFEPIYDFILHNIKWYWTP